MPPDHTDSAAVEAAILRLVDAAALGKTVNPTDVARELRPGPQWHLMMGVIRRAAVKLALAGRIVIYRKGRPVDPIDFKGVYRLGPGKSSEVRPASR